MKSFMLQSQKELSMKNQTQIYKFMLERLKNIWFILSNLKFTPLI